MLNREVYRDKISPEMSPFVSGVEKYIGVEKVADPSDWYWKAVLVYHLTPSENKGGHTVYIDTLDQDGYWAYYSNTTKVGWTWEGRQPNEVADPRPFEKNPPELRAQVDLYPRQVTSIWIEDMIGVPSEIVHGLRSDVDLSGGGNSWGHNSFVVLFQLVQSGEDTQSPPAIVRVDLTQPTTIQVWGDFPYTVEYMGGS